ncbi:hypothetical protein BG000_002654, partial [Podila horticola]
GNVVSTSFKPVSMPVTADAHGTFSALLTALVRTESRDIRLFGPDGPIGNTTLQNVVLNHGDNPLTAIVVIDLSLAGAAKFVSGLEKADATVTLTGTGSSPANPVTLAAVQSLEINVVIPQTFAPKTV